MGYHTYLARSQIIIIPFKQAAVPGQEAKARLKRSLHKNIWSYFKPLHGVASGKYPVPLTIWQLLARPKKGEHPALSAPWTAPLKARDGLQWLYSQRLATWLWKLSPVRRMYTAFGLCLYPFLKRLSPRLAKKVEATGQNPGPVLNRSFGFLTSRLVWPESWEHFAWPRSLAVTPGLSHVPGASNPLAVIQRRPRQEKVKYFRCSDKLIDR